MNRKIVIWLLTAVLLIAVSLAEAQQPKKVPTVGFLCPQFKPGPPIEALRQGLRELGYIEGKNVAIELRFAAGNFDRFPDLAGDLVRLKVDILIPMGEQALRAARQATKTIPIVASGSRLLVETGYIASLARPGGNITGMSDLSPELSGKRLELLREAFPGITKVAILWNPTVPGTALLTVS